MLQSDISTYIYELHLSMAKSILLLKLTGADISSAGAISAQKQAL